MEKLRLWGFNLPAEAMEIQHKINEIIDFLNSTAIQKSSWKEKKDE